MRDLASARFVTVDVKLLTFDSRRFCTAPSEPRSELMVLIAASMLLIAVVVAPPEPMSSEFSDSVVLSAALSDTEMVSMPLVVPKPTWKLTVLEEHPNRQAILAMVPKATHMAGRLPLTMAEASVAQAALRRMQDRFDGSPQAVAERLQMVATGQAEFGLSGADEILTAVARGADIMAVYATYQTSPQGIMARAERGTTLADVFSTGTLAIEPGLSYALFLKKKYGFDRVKIVPYDGGVAFDRRGLCAALRRLSFDRAQCLSPVDGAAAPEAA